MSMPAPPVAGAQPLAATARSERYDRRTIVLHWVTAVLVAALWAIGELIDSFPRGTPRVTVRSVHISLGVALAIVLVLRLLWLWGARRVAPPAVPGLLGRAATAMHAILYALLGLTVAFGIFNAWARGDTVFNWFTVPRLLPRYPDLREISEELHELSANTLVILAGLHALAGLFHHYVLRDKVLLGILPQWHRSHGAARNHGRTPS